MRTKFTLYGFALGLFVLATLGAVSLTDKFLPNLRVAGTNYANYAEVTNNLTIGGTLDVQGGGSSYFSNDVTFAGNILPATATNDIGSALAPFRHGYFSTASIHVGTNIFGASGATPLWNGGAIPGSIGTVLNTGASSNTIVPTYIDASGTNISPSTVTISSGSMNVPGDLTVGGSIVIPTPGVVIATKAFQSYQGTLTHAGTVTLDFDGTTTVNSMTLTGNVTFATSNLATNRTYRLKITGCSTNSTLTFPAWKFVTGVLPSVSTANKVAMLSLEAWGANDTNVVAAYGEAP